MTNEKQQGCGYEHKSLIKEVVDDSYSPMSAAAVNFLLSFVYVEECQDNPDHVKVGGYKWSCLTATKRRVVKDFPPKDIYLSNNIPS